MKKNYTLILGLMFTLPSVAQKASENENGVTVIQCEKFGISRPLRELFVNEEELTNEKIELEESKDRERRIPQNYLFTAEDGPEYGNDESVHQTFMGDIVNKAPLTSWAGQTGGGYPPDPSGAAGTNYYVQAVNATPFKVYNKTTGAGVGTVKQIGSLWSPATPNNGDPIILYDKYADRWFLSQFGITGNKMYIAISTTNDPTGTYYTYTFSSPDFPDYLKFSIWWDGYYMTANYGEKVFVFERDQMLIGNPSARAISKTFTTATGGGFFLPMPGDADGSLPAVGTAFPFFQYTDNGWGGSSTDAIKIFKMTTTWGTTPSATIATDATVALAAFDASYSPSWNDISQPGTTSKLDGIGGIIQFRAPWRRWTGYNSVVLNFPVKISSSQRSIRWVELRQDQTTLAWTKYQEGTYTPDSKSRWVGSIAMDDNGSIGLCYAVADGTSQYASLAYTGRKASDPLGTMTLAETIVKAGTGSQTATNRFGDYSQTSLDPDGLTFWHTGEYIGGSGTSGSPRTWIYSFRIPTVTGTPEENIDAKLTVSQNGDLLNVLGENINLTGELVVDLFDVNGKLISGNTVNMAGKSFTTSINVSSIAGGTYLVRIGQNNTSFQKVVKVVITK